MKLLIPSAITTHANINTSLAYPVERNQNKTDALDTLTSDYSKWTSALRSADSLQTLDVVVIPLIHKYPELVKNLTRVITQLDRCNASNALFLCSGDVDVHYIARLLPTSISSTNWIVLQGDYHAFEDSLGLKTRRSTLSYGRSKDIAEKRNFAISLSQRMRWQTLFFLDCDVTISDRDLRVARELLTEAPGVVGFRANDFPDNSASSHIYRYLGGSVGTFIGSGALAINVSNSVPFFPSIYNEDWLFMLPYSLMKGGIWYAGEMSQEPYNPFVSAPYVRADLEESGEIIAGALFNLAMSLRRQGVTESALQDAATLIAVHGDETFWRKSIYHRLVFISEMRAGLSKRSGTDVAAMRMSLDALVRHYTVKSDKGTIDTTLLAEWVRDWADDSAAWSSHLTSLPAAANLEDALSSIGEDFQTIVFRNNNHRSKKRPKALISKVSYDELPLSRSKQGGIDFTKFIETNILSGSDLRRITKEADEYEIVVANKTSKGIYNSFTSRHFVGLAFEYNDDIEIIVHTIRDYIKVIDSRSRVAVALWIFGKNISNTDYQIYLRKIVGRLLTDDISSSVVLFVPKHSKNIFSVQEHKSCFDGLLLYIWKHDLWTVQNVISINSRGELLSSHHLNITNDPTLGGSDDILTSTPTSVDGSKLLPIDSSMAHYLLNTYDYPHLSFKAVLRDWQENLLSRIITDRLSRGLQRQNISISLADVLHYNLTLHSKSSQQDTRLGDI